MKRLLRDHQKRSLKNYCNSVGIISLGLLTVCCTLKRHLHKIKISQITDRAISWQKPVTTSCKALDAKRETIFGMPKIRSTSQTSGQVSTGYHDTGMAMV